MPVGALRAAIAGIGAVAGKRQPALGAQRLGGGAHEQADLPVAGVIAERKRRSVRLANPALGAEDQRFGATQLRRRPAHADVQRPAEDVAAGALEQVVRLER